MTKQSLNEQYYPIFHGVELATLYYAQTYANAITALYTNDLADKDFQDFIISYNLGTTAGIPDSTKETKMKDIIKLATHIKDYIFEYYLEFDETPDIQDIYNTFNPDRK